MARTPLLKRDLSAPALLTRMGAPRGKAASRLWVDRAGHLSMDHAQPLFTALQAGDGNGRQKRPGVWVQWFVKQLF